MDGADAAQADQQYAEELHLAAAYVLGRQRDGANIALVLQSLCAVVGQTALQLQEHFGKPPGTTRTLVELCAAWIGEEAALMAALSPAQRAAGHRGRLQ